MHKLAKGLKKKKKPKKGKKGAEDEEFDPEELERYRRERAEAQAKELQEAANESGTPANAAGSDEWKKFEALTAGVDSILKKTQGDLDRIKSTSFFQRKAPPPEPNPEDDPEVQAAKREQAKRYVGFDKDGNPIEQKEETERKSKVTVNQDGFAEIPDDDDEEEDSAEEDIFDTTYLDVLQNIEVHLAYIPDSPTTEEVGDDPFDTTNADKVLKTVDKTGKKLVSLGNAVEVLSGRIDHVSTCKISRPRKTQTQDLLLGDFDGEVPSVENSSDQPSGEVIVEKTLLDDDTDLPDVPVDLTNLPQVLPIPVTSESNKTDDKVIENQIDISEFEEFKEKTILEEIPDLDDAEFDLGGLEENPILEETDDPFAEKEVGTTDFQEEIIEASFVAATFVNEEDPFDTAFAENIVPGKTELKFIEKELEELPVSEVSISLTDPAGLHRDYETGLLSLVAKAKNATSSGISETSPDFLGGSVTDLTQLVDEPIQPVVELSYVDPFDTSSIKDQPPGKTELKFLEQELLGEIKPTQESLDDDDFDPRKGEPVIVQQPVVKAPPPARPPPITPVVGSLEDNEIEAQASNQTRKPSRPEALSIGPSKVVAFELPSPSKKPDLLATSEEENAIPGKPLTPYYPQKSIEETLPKDDLDEADVDPFDTSFVGKVAPGKTELKLLESELLEKQEPQLTRSLSDHEFDPRQLQASQDHLRRQSDFCVSTGKPQVVNSSQVINSLIKRKQNLESIKRQESVLDTEVDIDAKPLTPNIESKRIDEEDEEISYVDPFDTSHASNILPGKAELKLLENELSQISEKPLLPNPVLNLISKVVPLQDDDDFDPRADEPKEEPDFFCLEEHETTDKVLTPLQESAADDIDPFDTSFASIGPGKTELKLLESELIDK